MRIVLLAWNTYKLVDYRVRRILTSNRLRVQFVEARVKLNFSIVWLKVRVELYSPRTEDSI